MTTAPDAIFAAALDSAGLLATAPPPVPATRNEDMVSRRIAGERLQSIADSYGVTRERVRQITDQLAPWKPWNALRTERRTIAAEVAKVAAQALAPDCACCGETVSTPHRRLFCSETCAEMFTAVRYHLIDDTWRRRQRVANARIALRSGDGKDAERARRVIANGGAPLDSSRRWITPGTFVHHVIETALANDWPLVKLIDPAVLARPPFVDTPADVATAA